MEAGSSIIMQSPAAIIPEIMSPSFRFQSALSLLPQSNMSLPPVPAGMARRRRSSKSTTAVGIKRAASTPNVRGLAMDEAALSLADKRRNKLGYHRTSVACVHCRRRKIRCLLAPNDPQSRCSNCIRLKKECNFFPVDQQPPIERRPRTGSKLETRSADASNSSSSSPGQHGDHVIEQTDHFNHYPPFPMSAHEFAGSITSLSPDILSPPASAAPFSARTFDFPLQHERTGWEPAFYDHGPASAEPPVTDDSQNGYWKVSEGPMTPAFSPYSGGPPSTISQSSREIGFSPFGGPRPESGWPVPTRSMSFGHYEDCSTQAQNHYNPPYPQYDYRRGASEIDTPSLAASVNSARTSVSEASSAPLSATIPNQPMQQFNLPLAWNPLSGQPLMAKIPDFGGWYTTEPGLAKVQEEDIPPHFTGDPAILYSTE